VGPVSCCSSHRACHTVGLLPNVCSYWVQTCSCSWGRAVLLQASHPTADFIAILGSSAGSGVLCVIGFVAVTRKSASLPALPPSTAALFLVLPGAGLLREGLGAEPVQAGVPGGLAGLEGGQLAAQGPLLGAFSKPGLSLGTQGIVKGVVLKGETNTRG
jgi:hypothetical protein